MASSLKVFNPLNRVIGPGSVTIDRTAIGYVTDDGIAFNPSMTVEEVTADQVLARIGQNVTGLAGTIDLKAWEPITDNWPLFYDQTAGSAITVPLAGKDFNGSPQVKSTIRLIEWWGMWSGGGFAQFVARGVLAKIPVESLGHKKQLVLDLSFNLVQLSSGFWYLRRVFDSVTAAPTETSVPANSATNVNVAVAPAYQFTKPMSVLALDNTHWSFIKNSDSSEVAFTPSFATAVKDGVTITDPTKIVLTPSVALTAAAVYVIKCYQGCPAADLTTLAADNTVSFTCAA